MAIQIKAINKLLNKMHWHKNKQKKTMIVVQIGEKESFMTITMISNILPNRTSKKLKVARHPRLVKLKLTIILK